MDLDQLKQGTRAVWGHGDYSGLSGILAPASRELCDACAVSAGQEVLDAAAGDGNFALACAREGAAVVACDLSPVMVQRGRARAEAEGYEVEWVEADVEALPFEDARFDCVGSAFGAFIAPRPEVAASELFRVVRPGGTVGMTAWVPGGFTASLIALGRDYAPPNPVAHVSEEWGVEENARARFAGLAGSIAVERRTLVQEGASVEAVLEVQMGTPPMVAAREGLPPDRFDALAAGTGRLIRERGEQPDGSVRLESEYLLIVGRKRG